MKKWDFTNIYNTHYFHSVHGQFECPAPLEKRSRLVQKEHRANSSLCLLWNASFFYFSDRLNVNWKEKCSILKAWQIRTRLCCIVKTGKVVCDCAVFEPVKPFASGHCIWCHTFCMCGILIGQNVIHVISQFCHACAVQNAQVFWEGRWISAGWPRSSPSYSEMKYLAKGLKDNLF